MPIDKEQLEKKIGEAIGLEMAAQKAVQELSSKGLLSNGMAKSKLEAMKKQANNHQLKMEELISILIGKILKIFFTIICSIYNYSF